MKEDDIIWKSCDCIGLPHYKVSNRGDVVNTFTKQVLKPGVQRNRYVMVCLRDQESNRHVFNLGRLVLMVFKPHPLQDVRGQIEADHIDRNPLNNCLENLRWLTRTENRSQKKQHHKYRKKYNLGVLLVKYDIDNETFRHFPVKVEEYARQADINIPQSVVSTLLQFRHYSRKYQCRIYYKGQLPEIFQNLPHEVMTERTSGFRAVTCYAFNGTPIKQYHKLSDVKEDGFNIYRVYNAARDNVEYKGLKWKFDEDGRIKKTEP